MLLFALSETARFGGDIARHLGANLSPLEERTFEDGEHKSRPLVSVRGKDVYVVQSLHAGPEASANDKLCKLLFFLSTLRENGAARITALVPYLAYARKDRQTKSRDPVTTQYVARLFEAAGAHCVVTLDVHNIAAFQNAFRCTTVHLDTRALFANHLLNDMAARPVVVLSPDPGGVKRAQLFREMLEKRLRKPVGQAFAEKRRSAGVVSGDLLVGEAKVGGVLLESAMRDDALWHVVVGIGVNLEVPAGVADAGAIGARVGEGAILIAFLERFAAGYRAGALSERDGRLRMTQGPADLREVIDGMTPFLEG